jgi:hypothetical protein
MAKRGFHEFPSLVVAAFTPSRPSQTGGRGGFIKTRYA